MGQTVEAIGGLIVEQSSEAAAQGIDMTKPLPAGDTLLVMIVGMAIVFLGLTILIFLIKALIKTTDGLGKKKSTPVQTAKAPVQAAAVEAKEETPGDDELVAVITAALVCAMGGESQGFVVRRIRRV